MTQSLRQHEAITRRAALGVTAYDVALDLSLGAEIFTSVTTISFESSQTETFLDVRPHRLQRIALDGTDLDPALLDDGRFPLSLAPGTHTLQVQAEMPFRNDGEGLHRSVDPADGRHYVYGMCFMDAAPTVFACFDQPDLKAPYSVRVITPTDWTVVGNGAAEEVAPGSWELAVTPPLSTYFVTLLAGPYHVIREEHDGIRLGLSARASLADTLDRDAEEIFTITRQCFDEFHRLFGIRYPFGDYHQAFVPEFNAGAMENPGCVTFRDTYLFTSRVTRPQRITRATTIAHEMAHQWFGDLVTPQWWDDLWLNESFAEYMGNRVAAAVTEYDDAWADQAYARRQWGLTADQRPSTHPVAGNGAEDAHTALQSFDGISYVKGASVLKQLASTMGDEAFFGGVIDHLDKHRFGNATMADLFASWAAATDIDLTPFTTDWLRVAGLDTFIVDRADGGVLLRTPPRAYPADRPHRFQVALLDGDQWRFGDLEVTGDRTILPISDSTSVVVIDPYEQSWGSYHPDAVTLRALPQVLPTVTDPVLRAAIWNSIRSGYQDGVIDPRDVLRIAQASFPIEDTEDTPRRTMPWLLGSVVPPGGPEAGPQMHAAALAALDRAQPGSEPQLAAYRAVIATAAETPMLRVWLDERDLPRGIDLDDDLRWRLLERLASLGGIDRAGLDAALAAAPNAESQVEHARAVASLPTPEGKAFAWERFTGAVDVPNYELEAAGRGMWRSGQEHLTRDYVDRYFTDLPATAQVRSGWTLASTADAFFPRGYIDRETLRRTEQLIGQPDLDPSLRRRLVDAGDDLSRLLSIRERYAE